MRVALVHELLTMRGGAERMLRVVAEMFPDAPIHTLLYDERKLGEWFPAERVRTSSLQKYARIFGFNHHLYLPFFPKAVEAWPFDSAPAFAKATAGRQGDTGYDLVISFSSAFAHGIKVTGKTKHICYVHSPARYLWDQTFDVLDRVCPVGALRQSSGQASHALPLLRLKRRYLERTFHKLRQWDTETADRPYVLLAASKAVQRKIELYWRRESEVLYPPVDIDAFPLYEGPRDDYYVIASTLVPYKRIEIAIEACSKRGRRLKIVGEGPHRKTLEKLALCLDTTSRVIPSISSTKCEECIEGSRLVTRHDTSPLIEFLGYKDHAELVPLLQHARAFIFPGEEDFGIAPIEAMACGTPVIAYRGGGALETIVEGETGEFFDSECHAERMLSLSKQETKHALVESLLATMQKFEQKSYSNGVCGAQAQKFGKEKFVEGLQQHVKSVR